MNNINLFNCKICIYGTYNFNDSCWEEGCGAVDAIDCDKMFKNKREV